MKLDPPNREVIISSVLRTNFFKHVYDQIPAFFFLRNAWFCL
jgi:hypothetical protein